MIISILAYLAVFILASFILFFVIKNLKGIIILGVVLFGAYFATNYVLRNANLDPIPVLDFVIEKTEKADEFLKKVNVWKDKLNNVAYNVTKASDEEIESFKKEVNFK